MSSFTSEKYDDKVAKMQRICNWKMFALFDSLSTIKRDTVNKLHKLERKYKGYQTLNKGMTSKAQVWRLTTVAI